MLGLLFTIVRPYHGPEQWWRRAEPLHRPEEAGPRPEASAASRCCASPRPTPSSPRTGVRAGRRIGRKDEARAELAMAVAMLREMGMAAWLPEAEAELAEAGQ